MPRTATASTSCREAATTLTGFATCGRTLARECAWGAKWHGGTAREIEGQPEEPRARELLAAKYQGWREGRPLSDWASESLPVVIDLAGDTG